MMLNQFKIAVVEDETDMAELIKFHLVRAGFDVYVFGDGSSLLRHLETSHIDLILLDLMLPQIDGLEICKILGNDERFKNVAIIMVTARDTQTDIVLGLELGADDYITKPFSPQELVARVKSVLRRTSMPVDEKKLCAGKIELFPDRFLVLVEDTPVNLTVTEFNILRYLMMRKGRVLSREQILEFLGEDRKFVIDRTVDVHIVNLRKKLGKYGKMIQTVRGIGYRLVEV